MPFQLPSPPTSHYSSSPSPQHFHLHSFDFQLTPSTNMAHAHHPQTQTHQSLTMAMARGVNLTNTPAITAMTPLSGSGSGSQDTIHIHHPVAFNRPSSSRHARSPSLLQQHIPHPYARLFAKKDEVKRRKIWNHAHEKSIFSPYELSTVGAPQRRKLYIASLEAHIDKLHSRLLELGSWPVDLSELDPFRGLNSKTAKSMVAGLQHDASVSKLKLLELERANADLTKLLSTFPMANLTRIQGPVTGS